MWLIFVLSSAVFFVVGIGIAMIANKACNKIIKDNRKLKREESED